MKSASRRSELRKLLNTCEDLQQIRSKMADPELERESRTRLRRQSKRKTDQLSRDLKTYHFRGPLAEVMRACRLAPHHFQILAVLLHRTMRCEEPALEGRLILGALFECSYDVLAQIHLLQADSPLRSSGLVVLEDDEDKPDDLLEARFVLSEEAIESFRQEIAGPLRSDRRHTWDQPYRSNRDFLVDLRVLHNLYKQRSERIFNQDRWNRLHHTSYLPGHHLTERIQRCWERLRRRLEHTTNAAQFPALRFLREHTLNEEEMMIVVHLLFKELFEGNAYADVADLLKLVSRGETDLIQNRHLIAPQSSLMKHEILSIEPMIEGRALTGESYLNDWVVNYLFGASTPNADIRPDERIDWHVYLESLEDSRGFYRDLDAN